MEESKKETKPVEEKKTEAKKVEVKETPKKEEKKETKTNAKKEETKKMNNHMVMIGVAIVVALVVAIVTYMLLSKDSPKKVVEQAFTELKTGAFAQEMLSGLVQEENIDTEMVKLFYDKLEWKILKETQEGENAIVEIEITNKDFKTIMENLVQRIQQAFKSALTGEVSDETITNWLLEELRNEEIKTTTINTTVTLKKVNGKWELENEENFYYATLPGLEEAINAIQ